MRVQAIQLPADALLQTYNNGEAYSDCYSVTLDQRVSFGEFVAAFYTTRLFKVERFLLGLFLSKPSHDADVFALANGETDTFAAWTTESRTDDQLLLCDVSSRTRSWLCIQPLEGHATRLFFGSAVVPTHVDQDGRAEMGWLFRALLGFHKLYSVALLKSAARRLTNA